MKVQLDINTFYNNLVNGIYHSMEVKGKTLYEAKFYGIPYVASVDCKDSPACDYRDVAEKTRHVVWEDRKEHGLRNKLFNWG